jgi:hypothetical protein
MIALIIRSLLVALDYFVEILPYFIVGVVLASFIKGFVPKQELKKHLGGNGVKQTAIASGIGCLIPLCTCGIVPVTKGMYKSGVGLSPSIAFLLAGPAMNPAVILLTAGILGIKMALARIIAVFCVSVFSGLIAYKITSVYSIEVSAKVGEEEIEEVETIGEGTLSERIIDVLKDAFEEFLEFTPYLAFGLIVAGFLSVLLPGEVVRAYIGTGSILSVGIASVVGIPMYLCAGSDVPLVKALLVKGMNPGAGLTLMVTAPIINLPALFMVLAFLRRHTTLIFVLSCIFGAILMGMCFSFIYYI